VAAHDRTSRAVSVMAVAGAVVVIALAIASAGRARQPSDASAGGPTATAASWALLLDGRAAGDVFEVDGCGSASSSVLEPRPSAAPSKRPGPIRPTDCLIHVALPLSGPVKSWVAATAASKLERHDLILALRSREDPLRARVELRLEDAALAAFTLPGLDTSAAAGTAGDPLALASLRLAPASAIESPTTRTLAARTEGKPATQSMFRVSIPNMDTSGVRGIGSWRFEMRLVSDGRSGTMPSVVLHDLELRVAAAKVGPWAAWFQGLVRSGPTAGYERTATVELLDQANTVLAAAEFGSTGIIRYDRRPGIEPSTFDRLVRLYVERLRLP
jgi:hypothetical protein